MPRLAHREVQQFHQEDLVLEVAASIDRRKWNESRYEPFIDQLCGTREYQKEAIQTALRYLLGGEYRDLRALAKKNFERNKVLQERYGTLENMERNLQLPDQLSASLDMATGTGKSYVMYGIATIMLAEGAVDRVLLLCPSTTIETGLLEKFKELARDVDLQELLPEGSAIAAPNVINARESITTGTICIENYHAILEHVGSSIRDSLKGKGERTLILNDEAHHVANESQGRVRRWKEFLTDQSFGFRYVIGVSGTCYVNNDYFSDVISRYSLRQAIEENFVKKIQYVAEMPTTTRPEEKWQLVLNKHQEITKNLRPHKIRPLTIVITPTIERCKDITAELKAFLADYAGKTPEQLKEQVLTVYSGASDLSRLAAVNKSNSGVEWIVSVSMLNEGWDVQRVFQIVPHEERAFNSKLLVAQVLGRGLRKPIGWKGEQPEVVVFNHDSWAPRIRHIVEEIMEFEKRIPTFPQAESEFNFDLVNIKYDPQPYDETFHPIKKPYRLFDAGYVDLATEHAEERVAVEFVDASTEHRSRWETTIKHKTYQPKEIAELMHSRFYDVDDAGDRAHYLKAYPVEMLEGIVNASLKRRKIKVITDGIRQKFLQSMGTLQRKQAQVVRYNFEAVEYEKINTADRGVETVSASELVGNKTIFFTDDTAASIPDEYRDFYDEATELGRGYRSVPVSNKYDFRTSLNAVIADHENERKFIRELIDPKNAEHIKAWMKSVPVGFYEIDYAWKKENHQKRGRFSPDFIIKSGSVILIVEIKDDEEVKEPSPENVKKSEYAIAHVKRINEYLTKDKKKEKYRFNFITPMDFGAFFTSVKGGTVGDFRSQLDVKLGE